MIRRRKGKKGRIIFYGLLLRSVFWKSKNYKIKLYCATLSSHKIIKIGLEMTWILSVNANIARLRIFRGELNANLEISKTAIVNLLSETAGFSSLLFFETVSRRSEYLYFMMVVGSQQSEQSVLIPFKLSHSQFCGKFTFEIDFIHRIFVISRSARRVGRINTNILMNNALCPKQVMPRCFYPILQFESLFKFRIFQI